MGDAAKGKGKGKKGTGKAAGRKSQGKGATGEPRRDPDVLLGPKNPQWNCSICMYSNFASRLHCNQCGRDAPSAVAARAATAHTEAKKKLAAAHPPAADHGVGKGRGGGWEPKPAGKWASMQALTELRRQLTASQQETKQLRERLTGDINMDADFDAAESVETEVATPTPAVRVQQLTDALAALDVANVTGATRVDVENQLAAAKAAVAATPVDKPKATWSRQRKLQQNIEKTTNAISRFDSDLEWHKEELERLEKEKAEAVQRKLELEAEVAQCIADRTAEETQAVGPLALDDLPSELAATIRKGLKDAAEFRAKRASDSAGKPAEARSPPSPAMSDRTYNAKCHKLGVPTSQIEQAAEIAVPEDDDDLDEVINTAGLGAPAQNTPQAKRELLAAYNTVVLAAKKRKTG